MFNAKDFLNENKGVFKVNIEVDGLCKLIKTLLFIFICSSKVLFILYVIPLFIVVAIFDYYNRAKIYAKYNGELYVNFSNTYSVLQKQSYKILWAMFFGMICTTFIDEGGASYMFIVLAVLGVYEILLVVKLSKNMYTLKIANKMIILSTIVFIVIFIITAILMRFQFKGVYLYAIMGLSLVLPLTLLENVEK